MGISIAFWILAVVGVMAALAVVLLRDVFRAALSLVLCFLTVAGIYITLSADFLAAVQILIYVGAISVLIILAIMLTREVQHGSPGNRLQIPGFFDSLGRSPLFSKSCGSQDEFNAFTYKCSLEDDLSR